MTNPYVKRACEQVASTFTINDIGLLNFSGVYGRTERKNGLDDFQILYIINGGGSFVINSSTHRATAGSIIIFAPHEPQLYYYVPDDNAIVYYCHFKGSEAELLIGKSELKTSQIYNIGIIQEIISCFEEVITELTLKHPLYEMLCKSLITKIICEVSRKTNHEEYAITEKILPALNDINYMYNKNYSVEYYAKLCKLSKFYFLKIFKQVTGNSPIEYRTRLRLKIATKLLSENNMSVKEISSLVGFSSAQYFCRQYKKYTGSTPKSTNMHIDNKTV